MKATIANVRLARFRMATVLLSAGKNTRLTRSSLATWTREIEQNFFSLTKAWLSINFRAEWPPELEELPSWNYRCHQCLCYVYKWADWRQWSSNSHSRNLKHGLDFLARDWRFFCALPRLWLNPDDRWENRNDVVYIAGKSIANGTNTWEVCVLPCYSGFFCHLLLE